MLPAMMLNESHKTLFVQRRKKLSWILLIVFLSFIGKILQMVYFSDQHKLLGVLIVFFLLDVCSFSLLCYARFHWNSYEKTLRAVCACGAIEFFLKLVILLIPYDFITENYLTFLYSTLSTYFPYVFLTFSVKNRLESLYLSLQNELYDKIRFCFLFVYVPFQFIIYGLAINIDSLYDNFAEISPNPNPVLYLMFFVSMISIPFYKHKGRNVLEIIWVLLAIVQLYRYGMLDIIANVISAAITALKINLIIQDCIFYAFEKNSEYVLHSLIPQGFFESGVEMDAYTGEKV